MIDAGKLQPIVGTFASRRFSNRNPLIGAPDGYSLEYPLGVEISGERQHFDYRAALVTLPPSHAGYVPAPTPRLRPAIGAGFTPIVGLRIGGSFTAGPYLNDAYTRDAASGTSGGRIINQRVVGARSVVLARLSGDARRGGARVVRRAGRVRHAMMGYTYYGEAKYTFTPRFFVAGRAERNNYPFVRRSARAGRRRLTDFVDGELGVGYRLNADDAR